MTDQPYFPTDHGVSERDVLRAKNDTLLLVTGWLIGELIKHGHLPPDEVIEMLAGIGIRLYKDKP